jgi:hypothetical protein
VWLVLAAGLVLAALVGAAVPLLTMPSMAPIREVVREAWPGGEATGRVVPRGEPGPLAMEQTTPQGADELPEGPVPDRDLERLLGTASDFERGMLSDGVVTREEWLAAAWAAHHCLVEVVERGGEVVLAAGTDGDGAPVVWSIRAREGAGQAAISRAVEAQLTCRQAYFDEVDAGRAAFGLALVQLPLRDAIGSCLRAKGYDVPPGLDRAEQAARVAAAGRGMVEFVECETRW